MDLIVGCSNFTLPPLISDKQDLLDYATAKQHFGVFRSRWLLPKLNSERLIRIVGSARLLRLAVDANDKALMEAVANILIRIVGSARLLQLAVDVNDKALMEAVANVPDINLNAPVDGDRLVFDYAIFKQSANAVEALLGLRVPKTLRVLFAAKKVRARRCCASSCNSVRTDSVPLTIWRSMTTGSFDTRPMCSRPCVWRC